MNPEEQTKPDVAPTTAPAGLAPEVPAGPRGGARFADRGNRGSRGGGGGGRGGRDGRGGRGEKVKDEFDSKIVDLSRVTRVMAGGKRMRFRALVVVGDKKGRVGMAVSKGADVTLAVNKSTVKAKKNLLRVPIVEGTIPHAVEVKYGAAQVLLKPAPQGTGVIAGGPVRAVLDLAGIKNVVSKMKGSKNKIANVRAVMQALSQLRTREELERIRKS
ncbi:MAG: 30S ribosomal protein S5 [Patescibacteria group bacterium]